MLIPVNELIEKYGVKINGVLHLGAHQAEEATAYAKAGAKEVVWIEGNPELMPVLENELKKFPGHRAYNVLVSDAEGQEVKFKVTNNFQSSSILELGSHKSHHPEVKVHHTLNLKTQRLDIFFKKNNIDISALNFLNIDLQGAELMAMKGLGELMKGVDYVYTEVNTGSVYVNCPRLSEIDKFMYKQGFHRVALKLTEWEWGDALYVRKKITAAQKLGNLLEANYLQRMGSVKRISKKAYTNSRKAASIIKNKIIKKKVVVTDPETNGENYFLSKIIEQPKGKLIIFDVGANVGDYSGMVLEELKKKNIQDYELHLFEPQKSCFDKLKQLFSDNKKIVLNNFGLSDTSGEAEIHYDFSGSSSASLYNRKEISLPETEKIKLQTLDDYLEKSGIEKIHLLKIDTEGNEKKVLMGGINNLNPEKIPAVQFEYGGTYLDAGITLAEVIQLMIRQKYNVGKLQSKKIDYREDLGLFPEDYAYSNYVATDKFLN